MKVKQDCAVYTYNCKGSCKDRPCPGRNCLAKGMVHPEQRWVERNLLNAKISVKGLETKTFGTVFKE
jgi:hypothetical protein